MTTPHPDLTAARDALTPAGERLLRFWRLHRSMMHGVPIDAEDGIVEDIRAIEAEAVQRALARAEAGVPAEALAAHYRHTVRVVLMADDSAALWCRSCDQHLAARSAGSGSRVEARCAGCEETEDHPSHRTEYRALDFHRFVPIDEGDDR